MAKQVKEVAVIARYQFKSDPRKVCYLVRSSNGKDTYFTCLFNGKATSCQCPSRKPCKHMEQMEDREAARTEQNSTPELVDEETQLEQWTRQELAGETSGIPLADSIKSAEIARKNMHEDAIERASMAKRGGLLMPPPLASTPKPIAVGRDWMLDLRR